MTRNRNIFAARKGTRQNGTRQNGTQPTDYSDIDEAVEKLLSEIPPDSGDSLKGCLIWLMAALLICIATLAFWPF